MPTRPRRSAARNLAVALHDVAWLLPRTIGRAASVSEPLPTSEMEVMRLLARRPGLRVNQVATELGMRANNVSAAVRALEARKVLRRVPDEVDGRVVRLHPTAAALRARDRRESSWAGELAEILGDLSTDDRAALAAATGPLQRLADVLASRDGQHR